MTAPSHQPSRRTDIYALLWGTLCTTKCKFHAELRGNKWKFIQQTECWQVDLDSLDRSFEEQLLRKPTTKNKIFKDTDNRLILKRMDQTILYWISLSTITSPFAQNFQYMCYYPYVKWVKSQVQTCGKASDIKDRNQSKSVDRSNEEDTGTPLREHFWYSYQIK